MMLFRELCQSAFNLRAVISKQLGHSLVVL